MKMARRMAALMLALMLVLSAAAFAEYTEFADEGTLDSRCVTDVKILSSLNVINGFKTGEAYNFKGGETITRAQAAKMIYVVYNGGDDDSAEAYKGANTFSDTKGHWAEGYINACYSMNIVAGRGNGVFDPNAPVTGSELAKMLLVLARYKVNVHGFVGSEWEKNVMNMASFAGLLEGYEYQLSKPAPRQWAAKMFVNSLFNSCMAEYIGDTLTSGSYGAYAETVETVGWRYMRLSKVTGYVTRTANLDLGMAVSGVSAMAAGSNYGVYSAGQIGIRRMLKNDKGEDISSELEICTVDHRFDNSMLGHEVVVLYAGEYLNSRTRLYGVFETGATKEYSTRLDELYLNRMTGILSFGGYSRAFGGERREDLLIFGSSGGILPVYNAAMQFRLFDRTRAGELAELLAQNATWPVRLIDMDGNGYVDAAFITDSYYGRVERNNESRGLFTVSGSLWDERAYLAPTGVNAVRQYAMYDAEAYAKLSGAAKVQQGDVVKLTAQVTDGTLRYLVEPVAGAEADSGRVTYGSGGAQDVLGRTYTLGKRSLSVSGNYFDLDGLVSDKAIVYYTDGRFVVAGYQKDYSAERLSDRFAIVMEKAQVAAQDRYGNPISGRYEDKLYILDLSGSKRIVTYSVPAGVSDAESFAAVLTDGVYEYVENSDGSIYCRRTPERTKNVTFGGLDERPRLDTVFGTYSAMRADTAKIFTRERVPAGRGDTAFGSYDYAYSIKSVSQFETNVTSDTALKTAASYAWTPGSSDTKTLLFGTLLLNAELKGVKTSGVVFTTGEPYPTTIDNARHYLIRGIDGSGSEVQLDLGTGAASYAEKGKLYTTETQAGVTRLTGSMHDGAREGGSTWRTASVVSSVTDAKTQTGVLMLRLGNGTVTQASTDRNTVIVKVRSGAGGRLETAEGEIRSADTYDYVFRNADGTVDLARCVENMTYLNAFVMINEENGSDSGYISYMIVDIDGAGVNGAEIEHYDNGRGGHTDRCVYSGDVYAYVPQY